MPVNKDDLLQQAMRKHARRITKQESIAAGIEALESAGLSIDQVAHIAAVNGLSLEDIAISIGSQATIHIVSLPPSAQAGMPGRNNTTSDIALFAWRQKRRAAQCNERVTWKDIYVEWRQAFPDDTRVKSPETVREAYRRHYGDKRKRPAE